MHRESSASGFGLLRWLAIVWLAAMLLLPAGAQAQDGFKDRQDDEDDEPEYPGLISETEYESPLFGFTLEWGDNWSVNRWYEDGDPIQSDTRAEVDTVVLAWDGGVESAFFRLDGWANGRGGPDEDLSEWLDEDYIADTWDEQYVVEPLLDDTTASSAAVLYSVLDEDTDRHVFTLFQSVVLDDGTTIYLYLETADEYFLEAYEAFQDELFLNGDTIEEVFTLSDIDEAIAAN